MAETLNKYFGNLEKLFEQVYKFKNAGIDRHAELNEKRREGALQFVVLKKINRQVKYKLRAGRDELHKEKLLVDSNRLQLQNLLYEVNHLKREIRRCHQFKSQDEDIELLPEKEYQQRIDNIEMPINPHEKRLKLLECELNLRKSLSEQSKELYNSKKEVFQDIVIRMERLTSFAPSLRQLLKATQPLQEALQLPIDHQWQLAKLVRLLPQPLYLPYMNIHAMEKSFSGQELNTTVIGCEEDVHANEIDMQSNVFKKRARESSDTEMDTENQDKYIHQFKTFCKPHALYVRFVLTNKSCVSDKLSVNLHYFPNLGCVTISSDISLEETENAQNELALLQDILQLLYTNDRGDIIPILRIVHELEKYNISEDECLEYIFKQGYGRPYCWLQRMCGLEAYGHREEECKVSIPEVMQQIIELWTSRLNLLKQTRALINNNITAYLKEEELPALRAACSLVQWTSIAWEEYSTSPVTKKYIDNELANCYQVFYRAVIVRGSAKMECLINIPTDFPEDNPLWGISIYWNGNELNADNKTSLKNMELWVNSLQQSMLKGEFALIAAQLLRAMFSFDIMLETESTNDNPIEFLKEKHYIRPVAARMRERPFKFMENSSENLFTQ